MRLHFRTLLRILPFALLLCLAGCASSGNYSGSPYDSGANTMPGSDDTARPGEGLDTPNRF